MASCAGIAFDSHRYFNGCGVQASFGWIIVSVTCKSARIGFISFRLTAGWFQVHLKFFLTFWLMGHGLSRRRNGREKTLGWPIDTACLFLQRHLAELSQLHHPPWWFVPFRACAKSRGYSTAFHTLSVFFHRYSLSGLLPKCKQCA